MTETLKGLPANVTQMLEESGALLSGHFILTSGRHSANYMQCARLCAIPKFCEALAADLAGNIRATLGETPCDVVLAPAIGGIVIGYEIARQLAVPGIFAERDKEGVMTLRRGFEFREGQRVIMAEDVITTGGSVLEAAKTAEDRGAEVVGYACLFDRSAGAFQPGPPVFSVAPLSFPTYPADDCPLCAEGRTPAVKPGSRK